MGKKAKEHRKKVEKRNARLKQEKNIFDKAYKSAMEAKMAELKDKFANLSDEEVNIALNNEIVEVTDFEPTTETETETAN
jgi:hypothetical protein